MRSVGDYQALGVGPAVSLLAHGCTQGSNSGNPALHACPGK